MGSTKEDAPPPIFSIPSLMSSRDFIAMVQRGCRRLQERLEQKRLEEKSFLISRAFLQQTREKAAKACESLRSLKEIDVEKVIWEEYKLKDERLMTCLVPYRCGVNMILKCLPTVVREECVRELQRVEKELLLLKEEEEKTNKKIGDGGGSSALSPLVPHANDDGVEQDRARKILSGCQWIRWHEEDLYIATGKKYLERVKKISASSTPQTPRIPVVAVVGHEHHGKTSLLDALQGSRLQNMEPYGMTQTFRSFTLEDPVHANTFFTFLDTPGNQMFVETRFFSHLVCDYVLLVISIVDGVQSQTCEAIKVALNVDKPIVVVFTKVDLISDKTMLQNRITHLLQDLREEGLEVTVVGRREGGGSIHSSIVKRKKKKPLFNVKKRRRPWEDQAKAGHDVMTEDMQKKKRGKGGGPSSRPAIRMGGVGEGEGNSSCTATTPDDDGLPNSNAGCDVNQNFLASPSLSDTHSKDKFFLPLKKLIPSTFEGSIYKPVLNLSRECMGVCVSLVSTQSPVFLSVVWELLRQCRDANPPVCLHHSVSHTDHNAVVQAAVLDSSKHLFNEEEFRANSTRQRIQAILDRHEDRRRHYQEQRGGGVREKMGRLWNTATRKATSPTNRTSSNCLVLNIIVQEGVVVQGMHFVADQSEGRVDALIDYWGNRIDRALPGMTATVVDWHSRCGCPGAGCYLLSTVDEKTRFNVQHYRQMLQWFVEAFPLQLHLLRPRGMNTEFRHVGNYGQSGLEAETSLEAQLLYGKPASSHITIPESSDVRSKGLLEKGGMQHAGALVSDRKAIKHDQAGSEEKKEEEETSIGEYMAQKNNESAAHASLSFTSSNFPSLLHLEDVKNDSILVNNPITGGSSNSTTRGVLGIVDRHGFLSTSTRQSLEHTWGCLQPKESISSLEAYQAFLEKCMHVGVLLKVDSWYCARMLSRYLRRWGTSRVVFQVVGVRFGALQAEDVLFFGQAVKVVLCFRTPRSNSVDLDHYLETQDTWVIQTDNVNDITLFIKWCAISLHKKQEQEGRGGGVGVEAEEIRERRRRMKRLLIYAN